MKLVIAEKPSVAKSIAKVIGAYKREKGYLEGSGYLVYPGASATWSDWFRRTPMMRNTESGGWRTFRSFRETGCMR